MSSLGRILPQKRTGKELFCNGDQPIGITLLDFWQWGFSNINNNTTRGVMAEFLVAQAVGCTSMAREEWAAYDLKSPEGITIEVKSAAYLQSWQQERPSKISFGIPKTLGWDPVTNQRIIEKKRHAQVYVFALLAHTCKSTLNPLDVTQWQFYVVPTIMLDQSKRSQHTITLPALKTLVGEPITFDWLRSAILNAAGYRPDLSDNIGRV